VTGSNSKCNYTFTAETELKGITGVRLEVLADDRLPGKGPGRAPNGNFVLSEFELSVAPKGKAAEARKVALQNAQASFSQDVYHITTASDGKAREANTGGALSPGTGMDQWAVFETKDDVGFEGGTVLKSTPPQQFMDRMHTIGKFRILVTTAPRPLKAAPPAE